MAEIIQMENPKTGEPQYPYAYAMGGMKLDLVWVNPSPGTAALSTISVDLSDYSIIILEYRYRGDTLSKPTGTAIGIKGSYVTTLGDNSASNDAKRRYKINEDGLTLVDTYSAYYTEYGVPTAIYGIKTSYIVPTAVHGLMYLDDDADGNITLYNNDGTKTLYPKSQVDGIDTSRLLAAVDTSTNSALTYTATEDCYIFMKSNTTNMTVNGVRIYISNDNQVEYFHLPLKKGDIVYMAPISGGGWPGYRVFGIKH